MRKNLVRHAAVVGCMVAAIACNGTDAPADVAGRWSGSVSQPSERWIPQLILSMSLRQAGSEVTGTGTFCSNCGASGMTTGTFDVVGSNSGGNVVLLISGAFNTTNYVGRQDGGRIRGVLSGGVFVNDSLVLSRTGG
jgi:hypothetical protein